MNIDRSYRWLNIGRSGLVHAVAMPASEFDAFMAAHKRLVREATRVSSTMCDLDMAEALEDLRELEERT